MPQRVGGAARSRHVPSYHSHHTLDPAPPPYHGAIDDDEDDDDDIEGVVATATLLQPRVAVVLGVPLWWHPVLFTCRLLSICPAIWWSLPIALRLLFQIHALLVAREVAVATGGSAAGQYRPGPLGGPDAPGPLSFESRLRLTETFLAMIWCGASAYLSFFFTDCLMSRWLVNYTPQATIVRLLSISALNGYLTSSILHLMGGLADPRLLLPAWISIASILTFVYHITQRQINIRKETSISISVFSGASFISMVSLLAQLYSARGESYPRVPLIIIARRMVTVAGNWVDVGNITRDL